MFCVTEREVGKKGEKKGKGVEGKCSLVSHIHFSLLWLFSVCFAYLGSKMPHFSVFGDTVNIAALMESTSEPMRIQMSHTTQVYNVVKFVFFCLKLNFLNNAYRIGFIFSRKLCTCIGVVLGYFLTSPTLH